jgi:RNA polymerase sigma-70 factor (sigma-E family)
VPDDIITLGGPGRGADRERDAAVAIESLFHAHYPRLVYAAFSLTGDRDLAEQLAQEAYLRLWRRWRWISDPQAAPMYLQRTVLNLSRESIRRRVIERRALKSRSMERPPAPPPDSAELVELRRAIAALPARKRECVVLRYLLGMSEAETAGLLGVSVGTVKSQTHKGLRQLRERFDEMAASQGAPAASLGAPAATSSRAAATSSRSTPGCCTPAATSATRDGPLSGASTRSPSGRPGWRARSTATSAR